MSPAPRFASFFPAPPDARPVGRRTLLAVVLVAFLAAPGCLDLTPARVPDRFLEGAGGNGWAKNFSASQREPVSQGSFLKTQMLVYEDHASPPYVGTLSVITLRTLLRPSEEKLRPMISDRINEQAESKGIRMQSGGEEGTRRDANGAEAFWFVHNGTVERPGFFAQSAQVKVYGEIFQCPTQKTDVITVGLAQTTDVRSIGGVVIPSDPDYSTWREIVADPNAEIEGYRGIDGLAYNVQC